MGSSPPRAPPHPCCVALFRQYKQIYDERSSVLTNPNISSPQLRDHSRHSYLQHHHSTRGHRLAQSTVGDEQSRKHKATKSQHPTHRHRLHRAPQKSQSPDVCTGWGVCIWHSSASDHGRLLAFIWCHLLWTLYADSCCLVQTKWTQGHRGFPCQMRGA